MIYYLKGIISIIDKDFIVIDVNGVGYHMIVSHPDMFTLNEERLVYTYNVVREDDNYLVGFASKEEKEVFLKLLKVKGLGPKSVISALSSTSPSGILDAISSNNVSYLKKLPGLGTKAASQIILDLKGELTGTKGDPTVYDDAIDALKAMGFKGAAIDRVITSINIKDAKAEDIIKAALTKLGGK